jgi:hypothetical protein
MLEYKTTILKFGSMGEKTGWRYILVSAAQAHQLKSDRKTSFRVKGRLDAMEISGVALIPVGEGDFILPLNAEMRKKLRKVEGAPLYVELEEDPDGPTLDPEFLACLQEVPEALAWFETLAGSHQRYFSKWISDAKTQSTREKRLVESLKALSLKWDYGQMIRSLKKT